ncbi:MAG TPA: hypothetical protein VMT99_01870 [Candidatus Paceibacterota bacterium]|nr:hypothetical protein [Candidatus Paceibacterota bacterium]
MDFSLLLEVLFPRRCLVCGYRAPKPPESWACCPACRAGIGARPIRSTLIVPLPHGPPRAVPVMAACRYEYHAVRSLVRALKFDGIRAAAIPLGDLAAETLGPLIKDGAAALVPMPLAKRRERARGFNQADLIARRFALRTNLTVASGTLARTRFSKPHSATESAAERARTVRGSFSVAAAAPPRRVILFDDVVTTGATLGEAARTLFAAGVREIAAITVAATTKWIPAAPEDGSLIAAAGP